MKHSTAILFFLLPLLLISACERETPITYPDGGFAYPSAKNNFDSAFYFYPRKNALSKKDSFSKLSGYVFIKAFNEPNMSIKPMGNDVFRLYFYEFKSTPIFITFNKREMIIKRGKGVYMGETAIDADLLNKTEMIQYEMISKFVAKAGGFFGQNIPKQRFDSMVNLYPQMRHANYYKSLLDKGMRGHVKLNNYSCKKINLSFSEYKHLVSLINASGYWTMPHEISCQNLVSDGGGWMLEANTNKKCNYVVSGTCDDKNDLQDRFAAVCQVIINKAGIAGEFKIISDSKLSTILNSLK